MVHRCKDELIFSARLRDLGGGAGLRYLHAPDSTRLFRYKWQASSASLFLHGRWRWSWCRQGGWTRLCGWRRLRYGQHGKEHSRLRRDTRQERIERNETVAVV